MTFARFVVKPIRFGIIGFLAGLPIFAHAQAKVRPRPTQQQVAAFLKTDPTLSSGFETPTHKATVRVVKQVPGGVLLSYRSAHVTGAVSVVGPAVTVLDKTFEQSIVDWVLSNLRGESTGGGPLKCSTTTETTTTVEGGKTTVTTKTSTSCQAA